MDVLADVMATVRLSSYMHISPELSAPCGISFQARPDRAVFYLLTRQSCYLEGQGIVLPVTLVGGDLAMIPHGAPYSLLHHAVSPSILREQLLNSSCTSALRF